MRDSSSRFSFDEGSRLSSLLSELMDQDEPKPSPPQAAPAPTAAAAAPAPAATTFVGARPLGVFLKSIPWTGPKAQPAQRRAVASLPLREFWGLVNWNDAHADGERLPTSLLDLGQPVDSKSTEGGDTPPTVENLMSQFVWD